MLSTVRFFDKWFCWGIAPYPGVGGSALRSRQSRGAFGAPGYEYSAFQARVVARQSRGAFGAPGYGYGAFQALVVAHQSCGAFGASGYEYSAFQARVVAPIGRVNPVVPSAPRVMSTAPSRRVW